MDNIKDLIKENEKLIKENKETIEKTNQLIEINNKIIEMYNIKNKCNKNIQLFDIGHCGFGC